MFKATLLLDSISEIGKRLTTFELTFPRVVLAEFNTHRALSRNSASSRAIPIDKMLDLVRTHPFIPTQFGKPVKGMGAKEYWPAGSLQATTLNSAWWESLERNVKIVERCKEFGNKEDLNRLLEPFMWHTVICTATEFDNFFALRTNLGADWKIQNIANLMYDAYHDAPAPKLLYRGEWHFPLVSEEDVSHVSHYLGYGDKFLSSARIFDKVASEIADEFLQVFRKISVARCARVSYLTHDGKRSIEKDVELFTRLLTSGHWSPFEHVATPYFSRKRDIEIQINPVEGHKLGYWQVHREFVNLRSANFYGWAQFRKEFTDENITNFRR